MSNLYFIPNLINNNTLNIINKLLKKGDKFNIIYDQSFKPNKDNINYFSGSIEHCWSPKKNGTYSIVYKKYKELPDYIKHPKVVLTYKGGSSALHGKLFSKFYSKEIGTTNSTMYLLVRNTYEGKKYENFFNSKLITFLVKVTQYSEGQYASNEFKILNLISKPEGLKNNPTDKDIYEYYNLSKSEIKLIEEIVDGRKETKTKKKMPKERAQPKKNEQSLSNSPMMRRVLKPKKRKN